MSESSFQLFIDGRLRDSSDGRRTTLINPATVQPFGEASAATVEDVGQAVESAHGGPVQDRRQDPAIEGRACPTGDRQHRQADLGCAGRDRTRRPGLRLLCRRGFQNLRPDDSGRWWRIRFHAPAIHGCHRGDRSLEFPLPDRLLEGRSGTGGGKHGRPQTGESLARDRGATGSHRE